MINHVRHTVILLVAFVTSRLDFSFPHGVGTGRDRHYPPAILFGKDGTPLEPAQN